MAIWRRARTDDRGGPPRRDPERPRTIPEEHHDVAAEVPAQSSERTDVVDRATVPDEAAVLEPVASVPGAAPAIRPASEVRRDPDPAAPGVRGEIAPAERAPSGPGEPPPTQVAPLTQSPAPTSAEIAPPTPVPPSPARAAPRPGALDEGGSLRRPAPAVEEDLPETQDDELSTPVPDRDDRPPRPLPRLIAVAN